MPNDLLGRYMTEGGEGGPFLYFFPLIVNALLFAGFQFRWGRGERRQISVFLGLVSLFFLVIISLGQTKKSWYAVPLLPLSAMIIGVGLDEALEWMTMRGRWFRISINGTLVPFCVFASLGVIAQNARFVTLREASLIDNERNLTSMFLRGPLVQYGSPQKFVVIQQSFVPTYFYVAPTLFYVNTLRAADHSIEILPPSAVIPAEFNAALLCGATVYNVTMVQVTLKPILIDGKCGIYQLAAK
jgi:hypothetical protein